MAGRSSAIGRVIAYFKETDVEEAQAAYDAVSRIMANRSTQSATKPVVTRKPRKAKVNSPIGGLAGGLAAKESLADA